MKNKRINRILATTMMAVMIATPLASSAYAMETTNNTTSYIETSDEYIVNTSEEEDNMKVGEEITFTDREIYEQLKSAGYDVDNTAVMARSAGVNKVVKTKAGYDIYVSKNTLVYAANVGAAAIGWAIGQISPLAGTIVASVIVQWANNNIKHGRVFRFNKIKAGNSYKYAYIKSWNQ